ncbi:hypothetical protein ABT120_61030 [Nonomuraea angiospora]|uniref:hypothetical protein n=1 Tax=Nonomuraea angiospora TaxID=46172 RepID=UPI0033177F61
MRALLFEADLGIRIRTRSGVFHNNRLGAYNSTASYSPTTCANGPVNSGNSINSGNGGHIANRSQRLGDQW